MLIPGVNGDKQLMLGTVRQTVRTFKGEATHSASTVGFRNMPVRQRNGSTWFSTDTESLTGSNGEARES